MRQSFANPYAAPSQTGSDASPESKYSVRCSCGRVQAVQATQAGSVIPCICGAAIDVPRLSRLRASVGEEPIPLNTIERITALINNGELPTGHICPCCGRSANDLLIMRIECEQSWTTGGGDVSKSGLLWALVFFGWLGTIVALAAKSRPREEFGRDISVDLPLRVSSECKFRLSRTRRQHKLKQLLSNIPIYHELLREFPRAIVSPLP